MGPACGCLSEQEEAGSWTDPQRMAEDEHTRTTHERARRLDVSRRAFYTGNEYTHCGRIGSLRGDPTRWRGTLRRPGWWGWRREGGSDPTTALSGRQARFAGRPERDQERECRRERVLRGHESFQPFIDTHRIICLICLAIVSSHERWIDPPEDVGPAAKTEKMKEVH